ncbi:hypothetical protein MAPG_07110 [Magnaporthiopsis poae ATCC 64411]|uniref:Uncharacterized protein n=1 Tax=Magnaporthiopsis poae (strain ATCC 64411 / 73-15) TaxID=644358 RepID=A0A0C4E3T9_MAGP6|nr:hypothetical protein MAPG_07110 [Magnaporthiopsis poae ATCC 64411]
MVTTFSPKPSFHLCPDFSIDPPPNGHLRLGSVLQSLQLDGVLAPLDAGDTTPVPDSLVFPNDKPSSEKAGFSCSLKRLREVEGGVWAKIFGGWGVGLGGGPSFSALRSREDDETITVQRLHVRYFTPTIEYMKAALEADAVALYVRRTKLKKPVWMVTGLMWTEGASLSKVAATKTQLKSGVAGASGLQVSCGSEDGVVSRFDGSTPFVLGMRVRKIWWDRRGVRQDKLDVVGATLGNDVYETKKDLLAGLRYEDDETPGYETVVDGDTLE